MAYGVKMTEKNTVVPWVSDKLHAIIGLSDIQLAQYLTELAKRAPTSQEFVEKLRSSGTIDMSGTVVAFAEELWSKVPHRPKDEKPARARERELLRQQKKYSSYKLLDTENEDSDKHLKKKGNHDKKKRTKVKKNIRGQKCSAWESDNDSEDKDIKKESDSGSDEWERLVYIYIYIYIYFSLKIHQQIYFFHRIVKVYTDAEPHSYFS